MQAFWRVTLELSAALAAVLFRLRWFFLILGVGAVIWFGVVIANPTATSARGLVPLTLGLWAALALAVGYTLPRLPAAVAPGDGFRLRVKKRFAQAGYSLAIIAMLGLAVFTLLFSLRTLSLTTS